MTKVEINGFEHIERLSFRKLFDDPEVEVVAINDLTDAVMLAHLLKFDSVQGGYGLNHTITNIENSITVDDVEIPIFKEADPAKLPWKELDVDIVLECTSFFTSKKKSQAHVDAGAKKVHLRIFFLREKMIRPCFYTGRLTFLKRAKKKKRS